MNNTEVTIRQPKKEWFAHAAVVLMFTAVFLYFLLYNGSYFYTILSLLTMLMLIVNAFVECGTKYVFDESGVSRFVLGRERLFLRWDECIYIGVFNRIVGSNISIEREKTFACAKTPLMHANMREAREKEYSLHGNPYKDITPSWKINEAIKIPYKLIGDENYAKILELCGGERIAEDLTIDRVSHTSCTMDAFGWTEIASDCRHKPKLSLRDCMKYESSKNGESIYRNRRCRKCGRAIDVKNDRSVNGKENILLFLISAFILALFMTPQVIAADWLDTTGLAELLWVKIAFIAVFAVLITACVFTIKIFGYGLASYLVLNHSAEWTIAQSNTNESE